MRTMSEKEHSWAWDGIHTYLLSSQWQDQSGKVNEKGYS